MRKYRICEPNVHSSQQSHMLSKENTHHLINVLRLKLGSIIHLFNNDYTEFEGILVKIDKNSCIVEIKHHINFYPMPLYITLGIGLIKFDRFDILVEKSTELGVQNIQPLLTEHSSIPNLTQRIKTKIEHWENIAISAACQSGRTNVPTLQKAISLQELIINMDHVVVICLPTHQATDIQKYEDLAHKPNKITLLIGPEGGFSDKELQTLVKIVPKDKLVNLNLGARILRTETAAISAISIIQRDYGDLRC